MRTAAAVGVLVAVCGMPGIASAQQNPALSTEWKEFSIPLADCKRRAEKAVRAAELTDKVTVLNWSVHGQGKGYTLAVRCMPDQKVVFFVAAGPNLGRADKFLDQIIATFEKEK